MHEILHYPQKYDFDCGVAIVVPVLKLKNIDIKYDDLMKILKTSEQEGTHSQNIINFLRQSGFKVEFFQNSNIATLKWHFDLGKICVPMIQSWDTGEFDSDLNAGHFVFVDKLSDKDFTTKDPGTNDGYGRNKWRCQYSIEEFERVWIDKEKGKVIKRAFISISK